MRSNKSSKAEGGDEEELDEDTVEFGRVADGSAQSSLLRNPDGLTRLMPRSFSSDDSMFFSGARHFLDCAPEAMEEGESEEAVVQAVDMMVLEQNTAGRINEQGETDQGASKRADVNEDEERAPIMRLPSECLIAIFKRLDPLKRDWPQWPGIRLGHRDDHPNSVLVCASVCRRWKTLADTAVWHLRIAGMGMRATKTRPACLAFTDGSLVFMQSLPRFQNLTHIEFHRVSSAHWAIVFEALALACPGLLALELVMVKTGEVLPYGWMPRAITEATLVTLCRGCRKLRSLVLDDCFTDDMEKMSTLPEALFELNQLEQLYLASVRYSTMSDSIGRLTSLWQLDLHNFANLDAIPGTIGDLTKLKRLNLDACSLLTSLPASIGNLTNLEWLKIRHLSQLSTLPNSFMNLTSLKRLTIAVCENLEELPECLAQLCQLEILRIQDCQRLRALPEWLGRLTGLQELELTEAQFPSLPESLGALTGLEELYLFNCTKLSALPPTIGHLSSLRCLGLCNCESLRSVPNEISHLASLEHLAFRACENLSFLPPAISELPNLKMFDMSGSPSIHPLRNLFDSRPLVNIVVDEDMAWEEMHMWATTTISYYNHIRDAD